MCAGGVVPNKDEVPKKRPFYGKKKPKDQQKGELHLWWGGSELRSSSQGVCLEQLHELLLWWGGSELQNSSRGVCLEQLYELHLWWGGSELWNSSQGICLEQFVWVASLVRRGGSYRSHLGIHLKEAAWNSCMSCIFGARGVGAMEFISGNLFGTVVWTASLVGGGGGVAVEFPGNRSGTVVWAASSVWGGGLWNSSQGICLEQFVWVASLVRRGGSYRSHLGIHLKEAAWNSCMSCIFGARGVGAMEFISGNLFGTVVWTASLVGGGGGWLWNSQGIGLEQLYELHLLCGGGGYGIHLRESVWNSLYELHLWYGGVGATEVILEFISRKLPETVVWAASLVPGGWELWNSSQGICLEQLYELHLWWGGGGGGCGIPRESVWNSCMSCIFCVGGGAMEFISGNLSGTVCMSCIFGTEGWELQKSSWNSSQGSCLKQLYELHLWCQGGGSYGIHLRESIWNSCMNCIFGGGGGGWLWNSQGIGLEQLYELHLLCGGGGYGIHLRESVWNSLYELHLWYGGVGATEVILEFISRKLPETVVWAASLVPGGWELWNSSQGIYLEQLYELHLWWGGGGGGCCGIPRESVWNSCMSCIFSVCVCVGGGTMEFISGNLSLTAVWAVSLGMGSCGIHLRESGLERLWFSAV